VPAPLVVDSSTPQLTGAERREAERAEKADVARGIAEARAQPQASADERKRQEKLAKDQEKLAKEQAKRDAEAGRRQAEADRKAAEQAKKQAEADKKKQAAIDEAAAKVRAAESTYQSELAKTGTKK
jgi:colicin import membrane protein